MFIMLFITSHAKKNNLFHHCVSQLKFFQRFPHSHNTNQTYKYRTSHTANSSSNFQDIQFMFSTTLFIINLRVLQNKFCMKKNQFLYPSIQFDVLIPSGISMYHKRGSFIFNNSAHI